jgi:hypothetical protein
MREIRQSGSEGGEVMSLPDPYNFRWLALNLGQNPRKPSPKQRALRHLFGFVD